MTSAAIVLDYFFLAQVEDGGRWEDRFDLLVEELREEYGAYFVWPHGSDSEVDILFLLYPAAHHDRMVSDEVLAAYVASHSGRFAQVHVIVIGRNSRVARVSPSDVIAIVNEQCIPYGVKVGHLRALRPEDIDDEVRAVLVRLHTRRVGGGMPQLADQPRSEDPDLLSTDHPLRPPQERIDL